MTSIDEKGSKRKKSNDTIDESIRKKSIIDGYYQFWLDSSNYTHDSHISITNNTAFRLEIVGNKKGNKEGIYLGMTPRQLKIFVFSPNEEFSSVFTLQSKVFEYLIKVKFRKIKNMNDDNEFITSKGNIENSYQVLCNGITCDKCNKAKVYEVDSGDLSFPQPFDCYSQNFCRFKYDNKLWKNIKLNIQNIDNDSRYFINTAKWCDKCDHAYPLFSECNCDKFNNPINSDIKLQINYNNHDYIYKIPCTCYIDIHKNLLIKNSDYFQIAFSTKLKLQQLDKETSIFTIKDFPNEFIHLLYYIYNCRFPDSIQDRINKDEIFEKLITDCALFYGVTIRMLVEKNGKRYQHIFFGKNESNSEQLSRLLGKPVKITIKSEKDLRFAYPLLPNDKFNCFYGIVLYSEEFPGAASGIIDVHHIITSEQKDRNNDKRWISINDGSTCYSDELLYDKVDVELMSPFDSQSILRMLEAGELFIADNIRSVELKMSLENNR